MLVGLFLVLSAFTGEVMCQEDDYSDDENGMSSWEDYMKAKAEKEACPETKCSKDKEL